MALATYAMGCFWKPELLFRDADGATDAAIGNATAVKTAAYGRPQFGPLVLLSGATAKPRLLGSGRIAKGIT